MNEGEREALPYGRIPTKKCRKTMKIEKSSFGNHLNGGKLSRKHQ